MRYPIPWKQIPIPGFSKISRDFLGYPKIPKFSKIPGISQKNRSQSQKIPGFWDFQIWDFFGIKIPKSRDFYPGIWDPGKIPSRCHLSLCISTFFDNSPPGFLHQIIMKENIPLFGGKKLGTMLSNSRMTRARTARWQTRKSARNCVPNLAPSQGDHDIL